VVWVVAHKWEVERDGHAGWDLAPRPLWAATTRPALARLKRLAVVLVKVAAQVAPMAQQIPLEGRER
jgi:hypothetical protein